MKRLKIFHIFLLSLFFLLFFTAFASAVDSTTQDKASNEASQQSVASAPDTAAQETPPVLNSPLIGHYDSNEAASKAVEKNLGFFSTRIKDKFSLWLGRSGKYLELMKDILKKKDVPEDMVFLSLIESGF